MTLRERFKQWLDTKPREQIRDVQLEVIADDHAIKFAKWCRRFQYIYDSTPKSFKELLEIYKEEYGL